MLLHSLSDKYPWERYEHPYPPTYRLNSTPSRRRMALALNGLLLQWNHLNGTSSNINIIWRAQTEDDLKKPRDYYRVDAVKHPQLFQSIGRSFIILFIITLQESILTTIIHIVKIKWNHEAFTYWTNVRKNIKGNKIFSNQSLIVIWLSSKS